MRRRKPAVGRWSSRCAAADARTAWKSDLNRVRTSVRQAYGEAAPSPDEGCVERLSGPQLHAHESCSAGHAQARCSNVGPTEQQCLLPQMSGRPESEVSMLRSVRRTCTEHRRPTWEGCCAAIQSAAVQHSNNMNAVSWLRMRRTQLHNEHRGGASGRRPGRTPLPHPPQRIGRGSPSEAGDHSPTPLGGGARTPRPAPQQARTHDLGCPKKPRGHSVISTIRRRLAFFLPGAQHRQRVSRCENSREAARRRVTPSSAPASP